MSERLCRARLATPFLVALLILAHPPRAAAQEQAEPSLYERLGGVYAIATVVDAFIDRLLVNDVLNANPRIDEARHRVPRAGLKYRVTELVCQVTGGPCAYSGRSMKDAHAHLGITEAEWQAMLDDFRTTLDRFQVPSEEQGELLAIVESVKPQIVATSRSGP